jgi:hypothetical protein
MAIYKNVFESIKTPKSKFTLLVSLLGFTLLNATVLKTDIVLAQERYTPTFNIKVDPKQAFVNGEAYPVDAKPINLSQLGLKPGDTILIERFGYLSPYSDPKDEYYGSLYATFSTDDELLSNSKIFIGVDTSRVPSAIDTLLPKGCSKCVSSKIFLISSGQNLVNGGFNGILVQIPTNAQYLFIGVNDSYFGDNVDSNEDLAVGISKIVSPSILQYSEPY